MSSTEDYGSTDYGMSSSYTGDAGHYMEEIDDCVRRNPAGAILIAVGVGLVIGAAVRALQPQRPENRVAAMLSDIQHRLHQLSKPVYRNAARAADSGGDLVREGVDRLSDMHLDRKLKGWSRRLRSYLP